MNYPAELLEKLDGQHPVTQSQEQLRKKHELPASVRNIVEGWRWRDGLRRNMVVYEMAIGVIWGRVAGESWAVYSRWYV